MDNKEQFAIKISNVYKDFNLAARHNTIKSAFVSLLNRNKKNNESTVQHALKDISLEVKKGEFLGIVGRNGSGKSTLLKILAGIYQPNKGSVSVSGRLVPFIELGVGFNPELTGKENVYLNGALLNFSKTEIDNFYDEVVEFAELEKHMDKKLKNYSSGMQVRLAFAMAIRAKADILLIDEVLAVGDADFQRKCFEYFKLLKKNKKTVVFVSHDMNAIREYCDRAILIDDKKIINEGVVDKVATLYTRMFFDKNTFLENKNTTEKRWGDKAVQYKKITIIIDEKNILIRLDSLARRSIDDLNFGFTIKSISGDSILGTNTNIKKKRIKNIKPKEKITLIWKFSNILNDGDYFIEPAIVYQDGRVCDWWEQAKKFRVHKEERTPYFVNPSIDLEVERI